MYSKVRFLNIRKYTLLSNVDTLKDNKCSRETLKDNKCNTLKDNKWDREIKNS